MTSFGAEVMTLAWISWCHIYHAVETLTEICMTAEKYQCKDQRFMLAWIWRVAHTTPQTSTPTSGIRWPHHISICLDASRGSLLIEKGYMLPTGQRYASPVVISRSPIVPKVFPIWFRRESQLWNRISIIIGPLSDHWLFLSLTHSLTDWLSDSLPFSKLYWCDPGM